MSRYNPNPIKIAAAPIRSGLAGMLAWASQTSPAKIPIDRA
jgi:hypothetical protein